MTRRGAHHRATLAAGLPGYLSDLRPIRGRCLKRRCSSRWGVVRVTLDFRDPERIERFAALECAACGRVWRRCKVPPITSREGYQAVRLTLILPATMHRWYARGRWHAEGEDAVIIGEANISDLDEAARAHRAKAEAAADRKARARAKAEAEALADHERAMQTLTMMAELDAARAAEERAAEEREAAYR